MPTCCKGRQGGRVIKPSCLFRYERDPFYDLAATRRAPRASTSDKIGIATIITKISSV